MMNLSEIIKQLCAWTPFLLSGFGMNILISLVAMAIGTGAGWVLAILRVSNHPRLVIFSLVPQHFHAAYRPLCSNFNWLLCCPQKS